MAKEEGIAYLMALKRSGAPASAEAPAPERSPGGHGTWGGAAVGSSSAPAKSPAVEKRRSPRYKCDGKTELREEGCEVRTWASFTDISMHGCYVEAQATYPAGTVLHMKLEANGFKVEVKGNVRVTYPYLGMGIAFTDMSDEARTHLRELLGSITQSSVIVGPGIASTLPATTPLGAVPQISDPQGAIRMLVEFFENRQMLTREDFLRVLRTSQSPKTTL
ncbi:MAG: PilZ domain-containing protein [Candidatus Sulfotelmatobacter sp.]